MTQNQNQAPGMSVAAEPAVQANPANSIAPEAPASPAGPAKPTGPAVPAKPAKPVKPLPDCTSRDGMFAGLLFAACLLLANSAVYYGAALGRALAMLFVAGASLVYLRRQLHFGAFNILCLAACFTVTLSFAVFGETDAAAGKLLAVWLLGAVFLVSATGAGAALLDDFRAFLLPMLLFCCVSCAELPRVLRAACVKRKNGRKVLSVLIGLVIALPAVLVLGALLVSADAAFDAVMGRLDLRADEIFVTLLLGVLLFGFLFTFLFVRQKEEKWTDVHGTIESVPLLDSALVTTVLAAVSALYAVYLVSQLSYLVGGFAGVRPEELTFSAYARRGFGEMCTVCILNLGILFLARLFVRRKDGALPRICRALFVFICGFSAFLIASAIAKMFLYIRTYGLSFLRLSTSVFMFFLLFVFIMVAVKCFVPKFRHIRAILAVGCIFAILTSAADLNAVTVRYNLYAYESGMHERIDIDYLYTSGEVAVPTLARLLHAGDESVRTEAAAALKALRARHRTDLRASSLISARAACLYAENKAQIDQAPERRSYGYDS